VLFDFHGTIAQVEDPVEWVLGAAAECRLELDPVLATSLADRLVTAGRAGGPKPSRLPPHLAEAFTDRDLDADLHRTAYEGLAETVTLTLPGPAGLPATGLARALYERLLRPEGWQLYRDTVPTMRTLHAAGVRIAVLSNIAFDLRVFGAAFGFDTFVSAWVLSYEVGTCKPDPAIFRHACRELGVEPERTLMVGDTPADAGAVDIGCRVLILPAASPGVENGLAAVLDLALS
jgi:HAD superfamily hydrolase (TIGR01509 family)